jgi:metal-responsive CopG/Arc/MetJ family transcriptional regulator
MSQPATKSATSEISVTVDAELLAAIDALVARFPDLDRNEVIDEALRMWYRREQAAAQQFASSQAPE